MLPTPCLLCSPHDRSRGGVEVRNMTLDWEDGILILKIKVRGTWHLMASLNQRWGRWGNRVKRPLILQVSPGMATFKQGDVLIPFFLLSTGGQGSEQRQVSLTVRQKGRILWGWPLCVIIITKATESKSKKQFQHGVRIDFSLQQLHLQELFFFFFWWNCPEPPLHRVTAKNHDLGSINCLLFEYLTWQVLLLS